MIKKIIKIVEKILLISLFFSLALIFGFKLYLNSSTYLENRDIFIPKGSNKKIITYLQKKGINLTFIDAYLLESYGGAKSGYIRFSSNNVPREEFLKELVNPQLLMKNITFIPGETTHFFLKHIAKKLNLSFKKLER